MPDILNSTALTDIFGRWPSFHDAEVMSISFDRSGVGDRPGPTLEARVYVFRMTSAVDAKGFRVLENHTLVTLRFHGVVQPALEDFNHQNVLSDLSITDISARQMEQVRFEVALVPSFGVSARFQCAAVEVVAVVPYRSPT